MDYQIWLRWRKDDSFSKEVFQTPRHTEALEVEMTVFSVRKRFFGQKKGWERLPALDGSLRLETKAREIHIPDPLAATVSAKIDLMLFLVTQLLKSLLKSGDFQFPFCKLSES